MTRQVLRFPVGPKFRKILEDDHEWIVLTDLLLKPIVMVRSDRKEAITHATVKRAYEQLKQKIPEGKQVRIYDLHTHPLINTPSPSQKDWDSFISKKHYDNEERLAEKGIITVGYGIIALKGIVIITIPETEKRLHDLFLDLGRRYENKMIENVKTLLDLRS